MDETTTKETTTEQDREQKERAEFIRGLREFADFLERNREAPCPLRGMFNVFAETRERFGELARLIGGRLDKVYTDTRWAVLCRRFGPIRYELNIHREMICERRVVGTKVVPEQVIPTHVEEVVEWECGPMLSPEVTEAE
jgi:hypothetical protein